MFSSFPSKILYVRQVIAVLNMDAQALTNEEVKWVWGCLLSILLVTTIQIDSFLSNKIVLGNGMIWMHRTLIVSGNGEILR